MAATGARLSPPLPATPTDHLARLAWRLGSHRRPAVAFVSGPPRSGTTWVLEVMEELLAARRHWEPLNHLQHRLGGPSPAFGGERPHLAADAALPALEAFVRGVLAGGAPTAAHQMRNPRLGRLANLHRLATADVTLVKFVFAQRLLPWIARATDVRGVVLLRHPFAVVASMKAYAGRSADWGRETVEVVFDPALCRLCPGLETYRGRRVRRIEAYALDVAIDTLVPLADAACRERFVFAAYETLTADPGRFHDIARALDLGGRLREGPIANRPSATTRADSNVLHGGDPNASWRRRLAADEVAAIAGVMAALGLDDYDSEGRIRVDRLARRGCIRLIV